MQTSMKALWHLILPGLALLAGCDNAQPQPGCPLRSGAECYEFDTRSEFLYADWGPGDRLAVIYAPRDSSGQHRPDLQGLYTMSLDGSDLRPLVLNSEVGSWVRNPRWSPDGRWIAFEAGQIYKVSAEGGSPIRLTQSARGKYEPTWSPDGHWVAFQVPGGWRADRGLWAVRADGTSERQLPKPPVEQMCLNCPLPAPGQGTYGYDQMWFSLSPDWSLKGTDLVYVATEHNIGDVHIAVYDTVSAHVDFIYEYPFGLSQPRFSPDGTRIAFVAGGGGGHYSRVGVVSRSGSGLQWLAEYVDNMDWSPDGQRFVYRRGAFATVRPLEPGDGDLWIMNADGSGKRQITFSTGRAR